MALLFPKYQIPRSKHLQHTSAGGLLTCPMGWGISALCINPIHQLQAGKERHRVSFTLSKIMREEIFPLQAPFQRLEWFSEQGEGEAALSSGGFPGWDRDPGTESPHAQGTLDTLRGHWIGDSC